MIIKSSTALRNDYGSISDLAHDEAEPIYITKNGEGDLVLEQVDARALEHEVETVGIAAIGVTGGVERVHLLRRGGDEDVAVRAFFDLGLQRARGIEVVDERHVRRSFLVQLSDLLQRLGHGRGSEHNQLDRLGGFFRSFRFGGFFRSFRFGGRFRLGGVLRGAACKQSQRHHKHQQQCDPLFHWNSSIIYLKT